ncbi:Ff.00g094060.m01.CDS01 [Fusarium sp. VM40]|nr:Ff.00g094060.m01.CDS01 [Fusarium sp. VM40]
MTPENGPASSQGPLIKLPISDPYDQRHEQYGASSGWDECGQSSMPSSASPLARRMADLTLFLCPCCGWDSRHSDEATADAVIEGYQQLPSAAPIIPGSDVPYVAEKQPAMTMPSSEPYDSTTLSAGQQTNYNYQQPDLNFVAPLVSFPLIPEQAPLAEPLISDTVSNQRPSLPGGDFYTSQIFKDEAQLDNQGMMSNQHLMVKTLSQVEYNSEPSLIDTTALTHHNMSPVDTVSQYGMLINGQIGEDAAQNGWSLMDQHPNFDILLPNQRGGKRGPFKDHNLREKTAQTRKIGSCIRCRMQRIRCENNPEEEGGPCLTCKKVSNSRAGRFPCLRYKITDIRLFKPGQVPGYEWTRRWTNNISDPIQSWATNEEPRVIYLSEGLSNKFVKVKVQRFIPQAGDKLERTWDYKGVKKSVTIPPYAMVNLEEVKKEYLSHIENSMQDAFNRLLGPREGLLFRTYLRAWKIFRDPSTSPECVDLIHHTLLLWMSIRLTTRSSFIVGEETLGMEENILDETNPNHGKIPLPPVLGAQMDLVLIHHIQTKLRRELLDKLQKMMSKNKQSTWLVTYLVIFILLHNTALITAHDAGYAKKHGMKRRFAREEKVKEYHLGANILLAHFHYCNKGIYPFSEECKDQDLRTLAGLDEEKIKFVHATSSLAKRYALQWEELRKAAAYEHDYFFVSQLFENNWQPRTTI